MSEINSVVSSIDTGTNIKFTGKSDSEGNNLRVEDGKLSGTIVGSVTKDFTGRVNNVTLELSNVPFEGGGAFYFVVTGAIDALTSSATFKELRAAYVAKKVIFCLYMNKILYLSYAGLPNSLEFSNVVYGSAGANIYKIKITKRDEVTLETVNLTTAS